MVPVLNGLVQSEWLNALLCFRARTVHLTRPALTKPAGDRIRAFHLDSFRAGVCQI